MGIRNLLVVTSVFAVSCLNASNLAQEASDEPIRFDENGEFNPTIIIAGHAVIWNGRVVTWDRVLKDFRDERPGGAFKPTFYFTNGVSQSTDGWDPWKKKIMSVYREFFEPEGVVYASVSPRGGRYWDSIRSQQDLKPSKTARSGRVVDGEGQAVELAQIVILPVEGPYAVMSVTIEEGQVVSTIHEHTVTADSSGQFRYQPLDDEHFVAALHPSGFGITKASDHNGAEIKLQPWATLEISASQPSEQRISIETRPAEIDSHYPSFKIRDIEPGEKTVAIQLPAGKATVRNEFKMGDSWIGVPAKTIDLAAGERVSIELKPPSDELRQKALEMKEFLDEMRDKDRGRSSR